jgi:DNA-binding Xre family transcriptional regulator
MGRDKLDMQDIHRKTGMSRSTIANLYYERTRRIDFDTIEKMCELFNCEVGEFLYLEEDK